MRHMHDAARSVCKAPHHMPLAELMINSQSPTTGLEFTRHTVTSSVLINNDLNSRQRAQECG